MPIVGPARIETLGRMTAHPIDVKRNTTTGCSWCRMLALYLKKNRQKIKFRRVCSLEAVSEYHRAGRVYEGQRHAGSGSLSDLLPFRRPTGR
jgi:hypothetical protein